jgi:hypothetical protein
MILMPGGTSLRDAPHEGVVRVYYSDLSDQRKAEWTLLISKNRQEQN